MLCFRPSLVIYKGKLIAEEMIARLSLNKVCLQMFTSLYTWVNSLLLLASNSFFKIT